MNYGKSFTYIFEDENWLTKFLIGVVVGLIPIVQFATYGYVLEVVKNVRDGRDQPLPEWDDFGGLFMNGLKYSLGVLVYALPAIFVSFFTIPFAIFAGEDPGAIFGLGITAVTCMVILLSLLPMVLMPVLMIQYAKDDQISDMFRFSEMWDTIQADFGAYIILLLISFAVVTIIGSIGIIACFIGIIFTAWYAYLVVGHITGQFAAQQPGAEKIA